MAPPFWVAELPEMEELVTVRVPEFQMPPPKDAELPEMVELETVRMPELLKAPPLPEVKFDPDIVTPEIKRPPPVATEKIQKLPPLPLMLRLLAPRPAMFTVPNPGTMFSVEANEIV